MSQSVVAGLLGGAAIGLITGLYLRWLIANIASFDVEDDE